MTITRPRTARSESTSESTTARPDGGPSKRLVAGAVGTGVLFMFILTLLVAGGARESVITGLALIGAAAGCAMLALLSVRRTNRPQRWAFVPAAAMALSGAALALARPGDAVLTAAGWVWPPLLLALTVWMARESWRHLPARPGRGPRRLVVPVLVALLVAGIGGASESVALAADDRTSVMPGHLYDVGGYRLHLDCTGSGSPTVVLLSGLGEMSPYWARIAPAVAPNTRVCAYDRAGQGWSDSSPHPADGTQTARDLHALLAAAHEEGPFVLAGHSS